MNIDRSIERFLRRGPALPGSLPSTVPSPYAGEPVVRVESDAGPLWMLASDGVMMPFIASAGTWEPDEGWFLLSLLTDPSGVFVDAGANVGYFSRLIASKAVAARILAFEPNPVVGNLLRLNTWGLPVPVDVHQVALGDAVGTVVLESHEHNPGDTRVSTAVSGNATKVAAMAPLDVLVSGRVDVVKIDVQGFESEVIAGMQRIISENPKIVIIAELWPAALRDRHLSPGTVLRQYASMGLTVRVLLGRRLVTMTVDEILRYCATAGKDGQANIVLVGADSPLR